MDIKKRLLKDNIGKNDNYNYSSDHFIFNITDNLFIIKSIYGWATDFKKSYIQTNYDKLDLNKICFIIENNPELLIKQLELTGNYLNERNFSYPDTYSCMLNDFNNVYEDLLVFI